MQRGDQEAADRELSRLEGLRQALTGTGVASSSETAVLPPASSPPAIVALQECAPLDDEVSLLLSFNILLLV